MNSLTGWDGKWLLPALLHFVPLCTLNVQVGLVLLNNQLILDSGRNLIVDLSDEGSERAPFKTTE